MSTPDLSLVPAELARLIRAIGRKASKQIATQPVPSEHAAFVTDLVLLANELARPAIAEGESSRHDWRWNLIEGFANALSARPVPRAYAVPSMALIGACCALRQDSDAPGAPQLAVDLGTLGAWPYNR